VVVGARGVRRLVPDDRVGEDEIVLGGDGDAGERRILRIESRVENGDPHTGAVHAAIGEGPQAELAIGHLRRAVDGVAARGAGIVRSGARRRASEARGEPEAAEGLDAAQVGVARQEPQGRGGDIRAHRVQPPAAYANACAERGRPIRDGAERLPGAGEQPHSERRVPHPGPGQDRRHGGPLRREARGQEREPKQPPHGC
jgi:hypothetical protein